MPTPRATSAAIRQALEAWQAVVGTVAAVEITRDGTIRIIAAVDKPPPAQADGPKQWRG